MFVAQARGGARLVHEPRDDFGILQEFRPHELEGDLFPKVHVGGKQHDAHATSRDALAYDVFTIDDVTGAHGRLGPHGLGRGHDLPFDTRPRPLQ
jgi:hypothetical protein